MTVAWVIIVLLDLSRGSLQKNNGSSFNTAIELIATINQISAERSEMITNQQIKPEPTQKGEIGSDDGDAARLRARWTKLKNNYSNNIISKALPLIFGATKK